MWASSRLRSSSSSIDRQVPFTSIHSPSFSFRIKRRDVKVIDRRIAIITTNVWRALGRHNSTRQRLFFFFFFFFFFCGTRRRDLVRPGRVSHCISHKAFGDGNKNRRSAARRQLLWRSILTASDYKCCCRLFTHQISDASVVSIWKSSCDEAGRAAHTPTEKSKWNGSQSSSSSSLPSPGASQCSALKILGILKIARVTAQLPHVTSFDLIWNNLHLLRPIRRGRLTETTTTTTKKKIWKEMKSVGVSFHDARPTEQMSKVGDAQMIYPSIGYSSNSRKPCPSYRRSHHVGMQSNRHLNSTGQSSRLIPLQPICRAGLIYFIAC